MRKTRSESGMRWLNEKKTGKERRELQLEMIVIKMGGKRNIGETEEVGRI